MFQKRMNHPFWWMDILTVHLDLLAQQTVVPVLVSTISHLSERMWFLLYKLLSLRHVCLEHFLSSIYAWAITTHHWVWVGASSASDFPFQWCRRTFSSGMWLTYCINWKGCFVVLLLQQKCLAMTQLIGMWIRPYRRCCFSRSVRA
jgi:hypothetical protein